jgi:hypothetical protein
MDVVAATARLRMLREQGHTRDEALGALRLEGAGPMECLVAIHEVERVGLGEAKRLLHESPGWADYMRANDESLIAEFEAMSSQLDDLQAGRKSEA